MSARRVVFLLGLAATVVVGISLRLTTRAQLSRGDGIVPLDSDSAYHLRRARFAAAHFPRTILFDPLMDFPKGGVPIWPPLFDLALAAPARIAQGAGASAERVEAGAAWVPVALAAAAIALAGAAASIPYGPIGGFAAALFVAICPGHILWTQYGHTDQHVAESATGLLALWAFLGSREASGTPKTRRREVLVGLALALAVLAWQGAIYWGALFALAIFLETLLLGRDDPWTPAAILGLPAVLTAAATAAWLGPIRPPFTYVSFGFFQPLFLAALAAGTLLLQTLVAASRRTLPRAALVRRVALLAVAAAVILPFAGDLARGLARGMGYVLGKTEEAAGAGGYVSYPAGWLHGIFEARPLLADGPALPLRQLSAAFFAVPVVLAAWGARAVRGPHRARHVALAVWGGVTLFLALSQRLNVYYAAPLAAFALIEVVAFVHARLHRAPGRGSRILGAVGAGGAAALLLFPMAPGLRHELSAVHAPGSDLFDTLDWMKRSLPRAVDAYDARLLADPAGLAPLARAESVLAPWSLGHLILYEAEQPVVANNFGYGFLDSIRFFLAESEEEALQIAERRRVRWVVATDLVPRLNDYAGYLGRAPYLVPGAGGPEPNRAYFSTMQSRLYDFDGKGAPLPGLETPPLARFRLIYRSKSAIPRGGRWLARWKVFEIVPRVASDHLGP